MWSDFFFLVGESCWDNCKEKGNSKASVIVRDQCHQERPDALQWDCSKVFSPVSTEDDTPVIPGPLVASVLAGKEQHFGPRDNEKAQPCTALLEQQLVTWLGFSILFWNNSAQILLASKQ